MARMTEEQNDQVGYTAEYLIGLILDRDGKDNCGNK